MKQGRERTGRNLRQCDQANALAALQDLKNLCFFRRMLTGIDSAPRNGRGVGPAKHDAPSRLRGDFQHRRKHGRNGGTMAHTLTRGLWVKVRTRCGSLRSVKLRLLRARQSAETLAGLCDIGGKQQADHHAAPKRPDGLTIKAAEYPRSAFRSNRVQSGPDCSG